MHMALFIAASSLMASVALGTAQAEESVYEELDADSNGEISQREASALPGLRSKWDQLDANNDGVVDMTEFARLEFASGPEGISEDVQPPVIPVQ